MPNTRETLIKLIDECIYCTNGQLADYLIANGVTISNLETVNWKQECVQLKAELAQAIKRMDECSRLLNETRKELEPFRVAYDEQEDALIRAEAKIEAYEFIILKGR